MDAETPIRPAATVILVRPAPEPAGDPAPRFETLLVRRADSLVFHGGSWVFPGGRVEPSDYPPDAPRDRESAALAAAVRELREETGLVLGARALVPFSHWVTPEGRPRRFAASFFLAAAPPGEVTVDGIETAAHRWLTPAAALAAPDLVLPPATFTSLLRLSAYQSVEDALERSRTAPYVSYEPKLVELEGGTLSIYAEDVAYDDPADFDRPGPRHRLWAVGGERRYEAPAALLRW